MQFGVVNKSTTVTRFVLHTLQRNITHLAVITRNKKHKTCILKGGNEKSPYFVRSTTFKCEVSKKFGSLKCKDNCGRESLLLSRRQNRQPQNLVNFRIRFFHYRSRALSPFSPTSHNYQFLSVTSGFTFRV